ncbi:MAG: hypothetical protein QOG01_1444 [Pseudonocardiales bacterium]|nr:hypothetical protein [Pseudonocardiales bacterium]
MVVTGGLIMVTALWMVITGLLARSQLQAVRDEVPLLRAQITSGDLVAARKTLDELRTHARRAHQLTTGPAWALAAQLPGGDNPIRTVRGIAATADDLASSALPALLDARDKIDPGSLRKADGSIDLAPIVAVAPSIERADRTMTAAVARVSALPPHTWLAAADHARSDLLGQLTDLAGTVRSADLAVHIAPQLLGVDGVKRYFVGFQNEAEARGTGGLPGAFAILKIDHGKPTFTRFESDTTLRKVATGLNLGADYQQLYEGAATTSLYVNSNISPNFPYAAQIWAAMWRKYSGQRLDGAIAVDPTALSYLLDVTGGATLPDGTKVDAGNVVSLTQSTVYTKFATDVAGRKKYLLDIAKAASTRIVDSHGSTSRLVDAAAKAIGERRILVWSADPSVEAQLKQTALSGAIPPNAAPFAGLSIVNDGGNKLDYYLDRTLRWQRTGCGATRPVTVTITLTNGAPTGLPAYVTARSDEHGYSVKPGDNRLEVSYFASHEAVMQSVTVGGKRGFVGSGDELGHPVYVVDLELPRGATRTIVFHLVEPAGSAKPVVLRQPLVRPLNVTVEDQPCG